MQSTLLSEEEPVSILLAVFHLFKGERFREKGDGVTATSSRLGFSHVDVKRQSFLGENAQKTEQERRIM